MRGSISYQQPSTVSGEAHDTPSAAVLDVGAHCGYYAAQAFLRGACAVYSYEPEAANYTMLERAHSSSSVGDRWQIQQCAIGAADGEADLFISSDSWSHSMRGFGPSHEQLGIQRVTVRAFDDLVAECQARARSQPVAVKLNVEGMAGQIVVGSAPTVWARVAELWFDHEPSDPVSLDAIDAHLGLAGLVRTGCEGRRWHYKRRPSPVTAERAPRDDLG